MAIEQNRVRITTMQHLITHLQYVVFEVAVGGDYAELQILPERTETAPSLDPEWRRYLVEMPSKDVAGIAKVFEAHGYTVTYT